MKILSILFLLIAMAAPSFAGVPIDYETIKDMTRSINALKSAGDAIPKKYDIESESGLRLCVQEYQPLRDQARGLMDQARAIGSFRYRLNMMQAADAVFACVYCSAAGSSCNQVDAPIREIKSYLKEEGHALD